MLGMRKARRMLSHVAFLAGGGALQRESLPIWSRPFAIGAAVLYFTSWVFPVTAGPSKNTAAFSKWWGRLDVSLASSLANFDVISIHSFKFFLRESTALQSSVRHNRISSSSCQQPTIVRPARDSPIISSTFSHIARSAFSYLRVEVRADC